MQWSHLHFICIAAVHKVHFTPRYVIVNKMAAASAFPNRMVVSVLFFTHFLHFNAHLLVCIEDNWCNKSRICTYSDTNINIMMSGKQNRTPKIIGHVLGMETVGTKLTIITEKGYIFKNLLSYEICHPWGVCFWNFSTSQSTSFEYKVVNWEFVFSVCICIQFLSYSEIEK